MKPPLTMMSHAHRLAWSTNTRKSLTIALTFVGVAAGTLTEVWKAGAVAEPAIPVVRYQMRDAIAQSGEETLTALRDLQLEYIARLDDLIKARKRNGQK